LDDADLAFLREELSAFAKKHPIFPAKEEAQAIELTFAWFRHCCPPCPSRRGLRAASQLLYLWCWFHGNRRRPEYRRRMLDLWAVIEGKPAEGSDALLAAGAEVCQVLDSITMQSGLRCTRLYHFLARSMAAFVWDAENRSDSSVSLDLYEMQRTHVIFVQPWVEVWRAAEAKGHQADVAHGVELERLEWLIRRHHYLANDLCSAHRDLALGKQSAIRSVMDQQDLDASDAVGMVRQMLNATVREVDQLTDAPWARDPGTASGWYVGFLKTCARGNVEVMAEFLSRYEAPT
jgi:hypothetical protein